MVGSELDDEEEEDPDDDEPFPYTDRGKVNPAKHKEIASKITVRFFSLISNMVTFMPKASLINGSKNSSMYLL